MGIKAGEEVMRNGNGNGGSDKDSGSGTDSDPTTLRPPAHLTQRLAWSSMQPEEFQDALGGLVQDLAVKVYAIDIYTKADHETLVGIGRALTATNIGLEDFERKLQFLWAQFDAHRKDEAKILQIFGKIEGLERELAKLRHMLNDQTERVGEAENDVAIARSRVDALDNLLSLTKKDLSTSIVHLQKQVEQAPHRMPSHSEVKLQELGIAIAQTKIDEETTEIRERNARLEHRKQVWAAFLSGLKTVGKWLFVGGGISILGGAIVKACGY